MVKSLENEVMTILGRLITLFPLVHFAGLLVTLYLTVVCNPLWFLMAIFWLYLFPLLCNQIHNFFFPLKEEDMDLSEKKYSAWWGNHQFQYLFIIIPSFEHILHVVPGLFSLWLRAWGSKVGKKVFWTPRVEILDRGLVEIGHGVVLGHLTAMSSHMVADIDGKPHLIIKKIRIGDRAFIGADSQFGPGTTIEAKAKIKPKSRIWWRGEYQ
jgi:acetyltransferase-like isoleucine patch superfamily enzyme